MTGQLDVSREEHLGIIALNRPEAINALNPEMIHGITRTLEQWRDDDGVRVVLFMGRGPRGFCAGGDVRLARQFVLDGRPDEADDFFAAEYFMNELIATFPKPTVALSHGVVMGGGIGIAGHCRYRFTTPEAKFAMPEAAIGFISDIGVNHILGKAPLHRAVLFLRSGVTVGPADALALGLADCVYDPARREAMLSAIAAAAASARPEAALAHLVQAEMVPAGEASFVAFADGFAHLRWKQPKAITMAYSDYPALAEAFAGGSPTSSIAIHESHLAARQMATIQEVLVLDLKLAQLFCRHPDFAEGVRALLVDKDRKPKWAPTDYAFVEALAAAIGPKPV
jgi:enoyl-CoA hydratase